MSNGNFQHESDDELLSAYIDGELSETERAAVETRLAADPDAQQLVHQLRSVSQSVQRLPLEAVGRDLSEAILRRAEALKPTPAADSTSAQADHALPKISIFQTRRSWVWASLAVAAGLLIMVAERGAQNRDQPVAAVTNEGKPAPKRELNEQIAELANRPEPAAVDESGEARKSVLAPLATTGAAPAAAPATSPQDPRMLADNTAPTSSAAADNLDRDRPVALFHSNASKDVLSADGKVPMRSDVPTDEEIRLGRIATSRAASPPPTNFKVAEGAAQPTPTAPSPSPPAAADEKRDMPLGEMSGRFAGGGRGGGAGSLAPTAPAEAGQPAAGFAFGGKLQMGGEGRSQDLPRKETRRPAVVVHLVATPESFQKKSFDKVLVSNGVVVEPQAELASGTRGAGQITQSYKQSGGKEAIGKVAGTPTSGNTDFDLVLVEAPKATIASCLTDLKNDAVNFVSLEVDEQVADKAKTEISGALGKQLDDFGRFNRGSVAEQQKESFRGRSYDAYHDFLDSEQLQRETIATDAFGDAAKGEASTEEAKNVTRQTRGAEVQGRARRLSTSEREGEQPAELAGKSGPSDGRSMERSSMHRAQVQDKSKAPVGAAAEVAPVENLQVLFVVSPQRPAKASAPTEKAAK